MSILSWDDYDDDASPLKKAENQDIAKRAAENLKTLDLAEAVKEFDEQEASIRARTARPIDTLDINDPSLTTLEKKLITERMAADPKFFFDRLNVKGDMSLAEIKARQNIENIDSSLTEGGRIQVEDKELLNCVSDLNQLVPFKYNWAWSLYLTSTENHWMPSEYSLSDDIPKFNNCNEKEVNILWRMFAVWKIQSRCFNLGHLLNCYRLITNPECRQYILRQSFEMTTVLHAAKDIDETFEILSESKGHNAKDLEFFKSIDLNIQRMTTHIRNLTYDTRGPENTKAFLENMVVAYLFTLILIPINAYVAALQVALEKNLQNLERILNKLLQDIQMQNSFIQLFIKTALKENPSINKQEFDVQLAQSVKTILKDLFALNASNETYLKFNQCQTNLIYSTLSKFFAGCGLPSAEFYGKQVIRGENALSDTILNHIDYLEPNVNHEAGLSGNGASLGW